MIHSDAQLQWQRWPCDNSGPNCPEVAVRPEPGEDGTEVVLLRDSERPDQVVSFSRDSWRSLVEHVRSGAGDLV